MSNFIQKSIIKSLLANLPKSLNFIKKSFDNENKKYKDEFIMVLTKQNDDIYFIPGIMDDNNNFTQKSIIINEKEYNVIKLEKFIIEQVEANM